MLSRLAESIYWMARYIERVENTARMIMVNTNLLLDLPRGTQAEWEPLVFIAGATDQFEDGQRKYDEATVLKFLLNDSNYPGSALNSLKAARENARTIRDTIPREVWEQINELDLYARENRNLGLSKQGRFQYLNRLILGIQTISGVISGTMTHNEGFQFLVMGRSLERADMTTRIINVRSADLLEGSPDLHPFETIQWVSVLKSLTAYQMYRQSKQVSVRRSQVLEFLFQDEQFPRSVGRCLYMLEQSARQLPNSDGVLRMVGRGKRALMDTNFSTIILKQEDLHHYVEDIQLILANIHSELEKTWFMLQD